MKRVVLNIHERQEEEDYQGSYISPVVVCVDRLHIAALVVIDIATSGGCMLNKVTAQHILSCVEVPTSEVMAA